MERATATTSDGSPWWKVPGNKCYGCEKCDVFLSSWDKAPLSARPQMFDNWFKHFDTHNKKVRVGNGAPSGSFAFTLTKSDKDALTVGDMLTAVRKIMSQKSQPVVKYAWYYEEKGRDENGDPIHPHIHGMYETATGGRVESKHFKRAWPIWDPSKPLGAGFRGGYHRPVRSEEKYKDYIRKDGGMSESYGLEEETD